MDCYDWKWCPGECEICDVALDGNVGCYSWPERVWLRIRRFFVRLWRRDMSLGAVRHLYAAPSPSATLTTHEEGD